MTEVTTYCTCQETSSFMWMRMCIVHCALQFDQYHFCSSDWNFLHFSVRIALLPALQSLQTRVCRATYLSTELFKHWLAQYQTVKKYGRLNLMLREIETLNYVLCTKKLKIACSLDRINRTRNAVSFFQSFSKHCQFEESNMLRWFVKYQP